MTEAASINNPRPKEKLPLKAEQVRAVLLKNNYPLSATSHQGVWIPLLGEHYEEAISHAACSARNLIDCAQKEIAGLGGKSGFNPNDEVDNLKNAWDKVSLPEALTEKEYGVSTNFITMIRIFFDKFAARITRKTNMEKVVPSTDAYGFPIPEADRQKLVIELVGMDGYFSNVLHQEKVVDREELIQKITRLEDILMDYILRIEPVDNLELIDQLIEKVEQP